MATQTTNYKLHKFDLADTPADITVLNPSMDIIDTQLKALADGKFDKTGGTISGNLVVNGSTTLKKLTASELDLNGNADVSGTLKVAGATTLTGKLTANGGVTTKALTATNLDLNGNGDVSDSLTVHGDLNAQGGLNVTDITATGATTLVNLNAANITATGTLKVNGATTLTGLLTANGGVTTKKVTATELDLNGKGDVSGNLNVGGLLQVTGSAQLNGGGTVKAPGATVNDSSIVPASWVWSAMLRYGLGGGLDTSPSGSTNEVFGSSDLNDWDKSGFYSVSVTDGLNTPTGQASWTGVLLALMRRWETGTSGLQIAPNGSAFWYRTRSGTEWNPWYILARDDQVVHRTGSESVAGIKNFSDNIQFSGHAVRQLYKNIGIAKGEVPSESQSILLRLIGGTGSTIVANTFSELELCAHNSGDTYVRLWAANNSEGSTDREYLEIRYNKAENRYSTRVPHPVTESDDNSIATTKWVNEKVSANVSDFGNWETPEATGAAAKSGIFTIISKHNTKVEIFVDEILRASTDKRDSYGTGHTSITCPIKKGSSYRITGAETISFLPLE